MTALSTHPPYPIYTDVDGSPLEAGYIFIGAANFNPETNPIAVYWDVDLTIPAEQPVRTLAGFPSRYGTPARLYVNADDYSTTVKDKRGRLVYSALANTERISGSAITGIVAEKVSFQRPEPGSVLLSAYQKFVGLAVTPEEFGAAADGVTNDSVAIEKAWAVNRSLWLSPGKNYYAPGLRLSGGGSYSNKKIYGNGATISGDNLYVHNMFGVNVEALTLSASAAIYLEGLRYCDWTNVILVGPVKWGKYNTTLGLSSWSTYWNKFTQCKFNGIEFTTSVADANFNSNTFDTCEFRPGAQLALMTFKESSMNDGVFASNTFIGCDTSYAPVFNIVSDYAFFSVTFIGGYLDTGTLWYYPGSYKAKTLEVIGLRNPSGESLDTVVSSDIRMTNGGARPKKNLPVGSLSLFKTEEIPTSIIGAPIVTISSVPLPYDGEYSFSAVFKQNGAALAAAKFENLTVGPSADLYSVLNDNGFSTFTFKASKGDVVRLVLDGVAGTDTEVQMLALTPGAGVVGAVPYRAAYPYDQVTVNCLPSVATNLLTRTVKGYSLGFYKIIVYTKNPATGGGGEKIVYTLAVAASSSSLVTTLTEVSRTSRNGNGGASVQSGSFALSVVTSVFDFTLMGTLTSATIASTDATIRIYSDKED